MPQPGYLPEEPSASSEQHDMSDITSRLATTMRRLLLFPSYTSSLDEIYVEQGLNALLALADSTLIIPSFLSFPPVGGNVAAHTQHEAVEQLLGKASRLRRKVSNQPHHWTCAIRNRSQHCFNICRTTLTPSALTTPSISKSTASSFSIMACRNQLSNSGSLPPPYYSDIPGSSGNSLDSPWLNDGTMPRQRLSKSRK